MKEEKDICYCKLLYHLPDEVECMKERCGRYRRERNGGKHGHLSVSAKHIDMVSKE